MRPELRESAYELYPSLVYGPHQFLVTKYSALAKPVPEQVSNTTREGDCISHIRNALLARLLHHLSFLAICLPLPVIYITCS